MGAVYEAMDTRLGRGVALKVLSGNVKSTRKAARRFAIEARAVARLRHPNVVSIYDFDVQCEYPHMAMELLQGETLAAVIARGPIGFDRLADIMMAVCAGVSAAHRAGIVHRDLKPSNIFLCRDWNGNETARVLDFGVSKVGDISTSELTQTGDIVGTSQYMSPEQASGARNVSELSDQYSLGVVMYECVTQQTPQRGQPIYTLLRNIAEGRHALPHELCRDLPPALEAIIERAMRVSPKDRFPSVVELARSLFPFASLEGKRQFADFCGPGRAPGPSDELLPSPTSGALSGVLLPPTERLASEPLRPWQQGATRTSLRPAGRVRRSRSGRVAAEKRDAAAGPSKTRRLLVSIALGAALAAVALLAIGLAVRL
jgi:eukaryotic-like serine/threonine-protein kinase